MISSDEHSNIMNDIINVTVPTAIENVFITTFSNLRNDTNYNVAVFAVNREGDGMTTTKMNIILHSPSMTQRTTSMCIIICINFQAQDNIARGCVHVYTNEQACKKEECELRII